MRARRVDGGVQTDVIGAALQAYGPRNDRWSVEEMKQERNEDRSGKGKQVVGELCERRGHSGEFGV